VASQLTNVVAFANPFTDDRLLVGSLINQGAATFTISGTPAVGQSLSAALATSDPDGNGFFSHSWQSSRDATSWAFIGTGADLTIAQSQEGDQLRLLTTYIDGLGFSETIASASVTIPFVNNGQASFSLAGSAAVGHTLSAILNTGDPDGGPSSGYSLTWQRSSNGVTWTDVVTGFSSYIVTPADAGQQMRLVVSYVDAQGFDESLAYSVGLVDPLFSISLSDWWLVAHMSNSGGMFDGDGDLQPFYSFGSYDPHPLSATQDYQRPFAVVDSTRIAFVTGDQSIWAVTSYADLRALIDSRSGDSSSNLLFDLYSGGNYERQHGNVYSRNGITEDPWITFSGDHEQGINLGRMIWGEGNYASLHSALKNAHEGLNVYISRPLNNSAPSGSVSISGLIQEGQLLQAFNSLRDLDGIPTNGPSVLRYQWYLNGNPVPGASSSSFVLSPTDAGKVVSVQASYTDLFETQESILSDLSMPIKAINNGSVLSVVSGIYSVGSILIASTPLGDLDGDPQFGYNYSWQTSLDGNSWNTVANQNSSYTIAIADEGRLIRLLTTYIDGQGFSEAVVTGAATVAYVNNGVASFTVTGTAAVGQTLTVGASSADPDGVPLSGYHHSWQTSSDGSSWNTVSSESDSYTVVSADAGNQLRLLTTYVDGQDFSESVSTAIDVVTGGDNLAPMFDVSWAGPHEIGLRFSESVSSDSLVSLAGLFSVRVNDSYRNVVSVGFAYSESTKGVYPSQLLLELDGDILDRASAISLAYTDPGGFAGSGAIRDLAGNRLVPFASQPISHFMTPISNSSLGLGSTYDALTLTGSSAINGIGNNRNNTIIGNNSANQLDGGAGADTLIGSGGDDLYLVDQTGDVVIELIDDGIDTVRATVTWLLGANVENLDLVGSNAINGTGNDLDNRITGNSASNVLLGAGGNDSIDGGAGRDLLVAGYGDDSYWVDMITDTVVEQVDQGSDTVFSTVSWSLGQNVENLVLLGTAPLTGLGNNSDNRIIGNSGANILDGGDDGRDVLTGGAGADQFRFNSRPLNLSSIGADVITDFNGLEGDRIRIQRSSFGITTNRVTLTSVVSPDAVAAALGSSALFVYDTSTGQLHWNQNGTTAGSGTGGVIVVLENRASLSSSNFTLV
jgi:Ca2+-binding RTX toxin-like protein